MSLTATQQHFTTFYLAAFLRAPDLGGLNYWTNEVLKPGQSLQTVGGTIFSLDIVKAIYPANLTDTQFVEAIYKNVFGRTSDAGGMTYWAGEIVNLRNGLVVQGHDAAFAAFEARGQLTMNMINAGLGTPDGTDGKAYIVNRLTVAEYAAEQQLVQGEEIAVAFLLDMFGQVDADALSVPRGNSEVNSYLSNAINLADIANGAGGFVINGQTAVDESSGGGSVSAAGDVNGDGLGDLIVGSFTATPAAGSDDGRSFVVFGKANGTPVDLSDIASGSGGFVINGQAAGYISGNSVSAAGDVNGDGLADLVVGAPYAASAAGAYAGKSYVVFGKASSTPVDLSDIASGSGGFVINGQGANNYSGTSVSAAGDVNGDGLADLIVGEPYADPATGAYDAGKSYVVFGKGDSTPVDLSDIARGSGGFVIDGQAMFDASGHSVSAAGDVNGDGLADLIVGAIHADPAAGAFDGGKSYVVFGKADGTAVELSGIVSGGGFVINGQAEFDYSGYSVSAAGDVNGDGLADLIIGAPGAGSAVGSDEGRSYVVFGKTNGTSVDLSSLANGTGGFAINGQAANNSSGRGVSAAGDVNGDGLADLIVGADSASPVTAIFAGKSYVVFGKNNGTTVNLSDIASGDGGFVINGQTALDHSGYSVSAAGDVNGDGLADLIVGAYGLTHQLGTFTGKSYVIFGSTSGAFNQTAVDQLGTTGDDNLNDNGTAQTLVGNSGNDSLTATAASVLYAGAGDDAFVIDSTMINALSNPLGAGGNISQLARIDGGTGIDTIALSGASLNFDLTAIANIGFDAIGFSRIESVEKIDLTGTGKNTLTLGMRDVMDMAGFNSFESSGVNAGRHQVMVTGNAGDVLNIVDGSDWTQGVNVTLVGVNYAVWNADNGLATLYVDTALNVI